VAGKALALGSACRGSIYARLGEVNPIFKSERRFLFRDTLLKLVKAEKLPYAELTKAA